MTLLRLELKQNIRSLAIWTLSIGVFLMVCVFMYPEMKNEMQDVSGIFSSMGTFSAAFGMDRLDLGALTGFYAVECGNILGIGGAFFAALLAVGALAKEESGRTAEFLLSHPVSRRQIVTWKLAAVLLQILLLNIIVFILPVTSVTLIGETVPWKEIGLLHLADFLVQIELACVCFGLSAFLRHNNAGLGLGIAAVLYFLNIIANISEQADFLKYLTPFGYAEGADILTDGCLNIEMVLLGMGWAVAGSAIAYWKYCGKDII
ncbi:MAG: ABC transporter permease subunit [Lachnospiraceae bacterium]|nr:ABC transporter permease subunit [Lachnospiraceae bacterium]MCI9469661.1 ABC transporter permease subunit [Lachnospiraceae bacterium]